VLGRRVWNGLTGQNNQPLSADLQDFFASSVKSGAHTGVQVAVSGAMVVAAKSGWLGAVLRNTPVRNVTAMVQLGMENAKTMAKFASGELTGPEALDTMGKSTTTMGISLAAAGAGAAQGAAWGAVLGPAGAFVGGLVGGVVGGMAGSNVGGLVYEGSKSLVKTGLSVAKSTASAVYSGAKSVVSGVASGVKSAGSAIASLFSW
jgi:phage tail tape-measure protein